MANEQQRTELHKTIWSMTSSQVKNAHCRWASFPRSRNSMPVPSPRATIAKALTAPFLQKQIYQDSMATTVVQLTIEKAKQLIIPLPPLAKQHRIVEKLEEILPIVDNFGKM